MVNGKWMKNRLLPFTIYHLPFTALMRFSRAQLVGALVLLVVLWVVLAFRLIFSAA
jgi:hypothetical protein